MKNKYLTKERKVYSILLSLLLATAVLSNPAFAQTATYTLSGTVKSTSDNSSIPGAAVQIKGTRFGAVSDAQGRYSFTAALPAGSYELAATFVGFSTATQKLALGDQTTVNTDLSLKQDVLGLDEVVVTGTPPGTTKRQLGNHIATVKGDQLSAAASGNVLGALQGKAPGAQIIQNNGDPAGGFSVRLRGVSTVTGSSEPLYIVDGVIVNNNTNRVTNASTDYSTAGSVGQNRLADINPDDIERIEVLNGAAAAALYGSRANAGVVQIFTKRGQNGKPVITFSSRFNINQLREKLPLNTAPIKFGPGVDILTQDVIATYNRNAAGEVLQTPVLPTFTSPVTRYDYQDYIFRTGLGTDNNISIAGGTDNTKYYISGGYLHNQGIVKNTDFTRYGLRVNLDQKLASWASLSAGLNYTNSSSNEKPDGNTFFSPINSITIIGNFHDIFARDANGNLKPIGERGRVNPVSIIEDIKQRQVTNRAIGSLQLTLTPIRNLTINYGMGIDNYGQSGQTHIPPFAYNVSTGFYGGGPALDATQNGYASNGSNYAFQINHDLTASYQALISQDFGSSTQIGYSLQYERNNYSVLQARGFNNRFVETVPGAATQLPPIDSRSQITIQGVFLQQSFKFKNQLFLTLAGRIDGSSVFAPQNRNQFYPKASGSFVVSETDFWKNLNLASAISSLKLRAAYGESGNLTGIGPYSRFNTYSTGAFLGRSTFQSNLTRANEDVKPERQKELEIGADISFLNDRIGLQVNVYDKKVDDLLLTRTLAPTEGFSNLTDNVGALRNRGFELALNAQVLNTAGFTWNLTGVYSRNKNEITSISQALITFTHPSGVPLAINLGSSIPVFYGTVFARNNDGSLLLTPAGLPQQEREGRTAAGQPSGNVVRRVIGDPNPRAIWSLGSTFAYKKASLRLQADAVRGNQVFNADFRTRQNVGSGQVAQQELEGKLPRGYVLSVLPIEEFRIDDGSFVKLREVALAYNLGGLLKGFNDLTLSLTGRNLVSWDNYKGYDPETNAGGQSNISRGIDFGNVPIPRTYQFGLTAKF